jgi:hypothetical protein
MFEELTNQTLLDDMLLDKWIYTLTRVGRKHMTQYQLWQSWIEE